MVYLYTNFSARDKKLEVWKVWERGYSGTMCVFILDDEVVGTVKIPCTL